MSKETYPEYRVRLFLSVDLVGSTKYKNKVDPIDWIKVFKEFYNQFPLKLQDSYKSIIDKNKDKCDCEEYKNEFPRTWKTVGDEILFCCRISSLYHLGLCIEAFIKTLGEYANNPLKRVDLDTKGNAWVASFPTPNVALIVKNSDDGSDDVFPSEKTEQNIDTDPRSYDFLGKDMDAGFRIACNSSADEMTLSPSLAFLLCQCYCSDETSFDKQIRFKPLQQFKGVADDHPYPVLVIDTCRDHDKQMLTTLENKFLGTPNVAENNDLRKYLKTYLKHHNICSPVVKESRTSGYLSLPEHYHEARQEWENNNIDNIQANNDIKKNLEEEKITDEQQKKLKEKEQEVSDIAGYKL